ncbi:type II toxin-antitoxin system RelE/ParE family toxin [Luteimonas sp. A611]
MPRVVSTTEFDTWVEGLPVAGKARVLARITNMRRGNFGDCEPVGSGVSESRIHHGPGYRLYFVVKGEELTVLLGGGDKSTQQSDIALAKERAQTVCE